MKKILCLSDGFNSGGAERQLVGLAYLLKEKGYDVELACYSEDLFYKSLIDEYNVRLHQLVPKGKIGKLKAVKQLINKNHYNVVIAYKEGPAGIVCILKLLGLDCKVIVSERNTSQQVSLAEKIRFRLYRYADFVVPNSFSQGDYINKNFPFLKDKVTVITNFTDLDFFTPTPPSKISEAKIQLLVVGRISEQKNVLRFLHALTIVRAKGIPIFVTWYGNISVNQNDYQKMCKTYVKENHLDDIVEFKPATRNIREAYQSCDVFCLPSIYEGFPNVICEAMCCGKPVLCSNVCDNPYIVKDGINGFFFNPRDVSSIVDAIDRFYTLSIKERNDMGLKSRAIAEQIMSKDTFVEKYVKII